MLGLTVNCRIEHTRETLVPFVDCMSVYQEASQNAFHAILIYYHSFETQRTVYPYLGQFNLYPFNTSINNLH